MNFDKILSQAQEQIKVASKATNQLVRIDDRDDVVIINKNYIVSIRKGVEDVGSEILTTLNNHGEPLVIWIESKTPSEILEIIEG